MRPFSHSYYTKKNIVQYSVCTTQESNLCLQLRVNTENKTNVFRSVCTVMVVAMHNAEHKYIIVRQSAYLLFQLTGYGLDALLIHNRGIRTFSFTTMYTMALRLNEPAFYALLHEKRQTKCAHSFLGLRLRMHGALHPCILYIFMACC
jgi:hypothetical protein